MELEIKDGKLIEVEKYDDETINVLVTKENDYMDNTIIKSHVEKIKQNANIDSFDFDYCDYITHNNVPRIDGIIVNEESFKNSPRIVPVVVDWHFGEIENIVGLAELEHHPKGVYAKVRFLKNELGENVRDALLNNLDIYGLGFSANHIKYYAGDDPLVSSGCIQMVHIIHRDNMFWRD